MVAHAQGWQHLDAVRLDFTPLMAQGVDRNPMPHAYQRLAVLKRISFYPPDGRRKFRAHNGDVHVNLSRATTRSRAQRLAKSPSASGHRSSLGLGAPKS